METDTLDSEGQLRQDPPTSSKRPWTTTEKLALAGVGAAILIAVAFVLPAMEDKREKREAAEGLERLVEVWASRPRSVRVTPVMEAPGVGSASRFLCWSGAIGDSTKQGCGPAEFPMYSGDGGAVVQKSDEGRWTLQVEYLVGGSVMDRAETNASYGVASVTEQ